MISKLVLETIKSPILVASHPRSGTHLTMDLLRKQFFGLFSLEISRGTAGPTLSSVRRVNRSP